MIQTGGIVYNNSASTRYLGHGNNAYGYYGMTGGEMRFDANWRIGGSAGSVGMIEVAGGVMNVTSSPLRMGYNGCISWGQTLRRYMRYMGTDPSAEATEKVNLG